MSIRTKLIATLLLLILMSLIVSGLAAFGIYRLGFFINDITENNIPQTWIADSVAADLALTRKYEKEFFLFSATKNAERQKQMLQKVVENFDKVKKNLFNYKANYAKDDSEKQKKLAEIEAALTKAEESFKPVASLLAEGRTYDSIQNEYNVYQQNVTELESKVNRLKQDILLGVEDISKQASTVQRNLFLIIPSVSVVVIIVGIVVGLLVSGRIVGSLESLMKGIRAIGKGNVNVSVEVKSKDELGQIARAFNETFEKLRAYIQTDEERKKTQENIVKFLDVVATTSDGDLTSRAPVTTDVFGSLADAYNLMLEGLSDILVDVRKTANMVGQNSRSLTDIFDNMSKGAEIQMVEVKKASESVDETSAATMTIADRSEAAQKVTVKATEAAKKGGSFVVQTIEGMQLVRVTVQTINKRMKTLTERLMEIGTISNLIGDIAARTNLLAMNASIEAARAGEQGKGFVVIAEEIRGLADKSNEAAKNITAIIKAIQSEAGEVTSSLEEETKLVENQTKIAADTGVAFRDIDTSIKDSNEKTSEILELSQHQRQLTQNVVLAMEEVNRISLQLLKLVKDSKGLADSLSTSSMRLLNSVSRFKLPEAPTTGKLS